MNATPVFIIVLRVMGVGIIAAGSMHIVFGLGADQMLGAIVSSQSLTDPVLDSQNRFYGAAFILYGVLLFVISQNLNQYSRILSCLLWVFLGAGLVRIISVILFGWPPPFVISLLVIELALPALLLVWFSRISTQHT
ncbi:MAG: DUF4345 domain-containing protein [Pseudomonadota bacterium]